jgi:hypothetical protein
MRPVVSALFVLASWACTPQGVCDFKAEDYCKDPKAPCSGRLLDPYTWESNPIHSNWLAYDGQHQWNMTLRDASTNQLIRGTIFKITPFVASDRNGADAVLASGNLTEANVIDGATIYVRNDTCANYFVRVVVEAR